MALLPNLFAILFALASLGDGLDIAFLMPPGSPMGPMVPVVLGCLDAGHNVTVFAHDGFDKKLKGMVPQAKIIGLGPAVRADMDEKKTAAIWKIPYTAIPFMVNLLFVIVLDELLGLPLAQAALPYLKQSKPDVICTSNVIASAYTLGELLDIPVVGLSFGPQTWMTVMDEPWSLEPVIGSWYSREEIGENPALVVMNTAARTLGFFARAVGNIMHNIRRFRLGVYRLQISQYESMLANPLVIPSLPEFTAGYPDINSPDTVMAGIYDHPALAGASLGKSEQHNEIIEWLDQQQENGVSVMYAAFGSEIVLGRAHIDLLLKSFENLTVLWALKRPPADLRHPANVWVTSWAPQKAVLSHSAVKGFLTHGGQNSVREALAAGTPMLIVPVMPDGPTVAMIHEELGVALRISKNDISPESISSGFKRICSDEFQKRAANVKKLNDKHVSLDRAVEVVENAALGIFPLRRHVQPFAPVALLPFIFLFVVASLCIRCCTCVCRRCSCGLCGRSRSTSEKMKSE